MKLRFSSERAVKIIRAERELAVNRIWILLALFLYFQTLRMFDANTEVKYAFYVIGIHGITAIFWFIYISRGVLHLSGFRIGIALICDLLFFAIGIYYSGEIYSPAICLPLVVSIGNGLSFGVRWGVVAAVGGMLLTSMAMATSPFWSRMSHLSIGIVLMILFVPIYVFILASKVTRDKNELDLRAEALEKAVKTDALTGALNRLGLVQELEKLMHRSNASDLKCAVLVIDLDGFKSINDIAGHAAGNLILKQVTACMRSNIRAADLVARFGGDEYAIVLSSLQSYEDAHRIADKIIESIAELRIANHGDLRVGASIGICYLPHPEIESIEDAIEAADMLMYISKRTGKGKFTAQFMEA